MLLIFLMCSGQSIDKNKDLALDIWNCDNLQNTIPKTDIRVLNELYVIGHFYGSPNKDNNEIPFTVNQYFQTIENKNNLYIALTGDVVKYPTYDNLQNVKTYLKSNFKDYFISPGNHDLLPSEENYIKVFEKDFFFEEFENFLLISPNFSNSNWLPTKEQQNKVNDLINNTNKEYIVLLSHQLFWIEDADFELVPNSYELLDKDLQKNSLSWIESHNNKNFIVISGDYGAFGQNTVCYIDDNKLFIANGIGELENDTIIKISETEDLIILEEINIP